MGDDTNKISCNIGSQEANNAYNLEIIERVDIQGDISNYKSGSITVKKEGEKDTSLFFNGDKKYVFFTPLNHFNITFVSLKLIFLLVFHSLLHTYHI